MEEGESLVHVSIAAEPLFQIGPLAFTNSMVGALLTTAVLLAATVYVSRRGTLVPGRLQALVEMPVEWVAGTVRSGDPVRWAGYVALIIAIFMTVLVANWIGLLPGVGTIGITVESDHGETFVPLIRPAAADLNFTLGLAIVSFVTFVSFGLRVRGVGGYLKELLGEPRYLSPLMFPVHLISELSRLISLSMRLFGNVFAGEVLLATMLALVPIFVPAIFLGLEALFGLVQALVFALLTMTYVLLATTAHSGDGAHGDDSHAGTGTHAAEAA